jgi:dihydroorotate dehydrogenase (fumarate)
MGMELPSPLVVAASPLSHDIDSVVALEGYGAGAIVLFSLFQEQFAGNPACRRRAWESASRSSYLLGADHVRRAALGGMSPLLHREEFLTSPQEYLDHIARVKRAVDIPVIASLNGYEAGSWISFAARLQEAGADALEINIYRLGADPYVGGVGVEAEYLEVLETVRNEVSIPVAMKLLPFFSSFAAMARKLDEGGAAALVLFNRFYQPDIDIERPGLRSDLTLSSSLDARLPLAWTAMLAGRVKADIAVTSGIHSSEDVIKALMAGAEITMLGSALIGDGIERLAAIRGGVEDWLGSHGYRSVDDVRGILAQARYADPMVFEREGYTKVINSYW